MLDDALAVLDLAQEQLADIHEVIDQSLHIKQVTPRLQALIKNVVENQRSALDYVAHAIVKRHGTKGVKTYWPYTDDPAKFVSAIDGTMPGVRKARPDLADTIKKYQPFQADCEWIAHLVELTNENKHRNLTAQTRTEQHRREVRGPDGRAQVSWNPNAVRFGKGVRIGGEPVDPLTQRTRSTVDVTYVGWLFTDLGLPMQGTLSNIQSKIVPALDDVCQVAGL